MHRAYQPILPCHNKLLQKKWDDKYYNEHLNKLAGAKPTIDATPPRTFMHLHLKMKKLQLEEERLATIERDNRILLEKMSTTMRTRGRVDNVNQYPIKSLNRAKRGRELLRTVQENQEQSRRLATAKAQYDNRKLEKDWQNNLRFMDNISSFPNEWWKMTRNASSLSRSRTFANDTKTKDNGKLLKKRGTSQKALLIRKADVERSRMFSSISSGDNRPSESTLTDQSETVAVATAVANNGDESDNGYEARSSILATENLPDADIQALGWGSGGTPEDNVFDEDKTNSDADTPASGQVYPASGDKAGEEEAPSPPSEILNRKVLVEPLKFTTPEFSRENSGKKAKGVRFLDEDIGNNNEQIEVDTAQEEKTVEQHEEQAVEGETKTADAGNRRSSVMDDEEEPNNAETEKEAEPLEN